MLTIVPFVPGHLQALQLQPAQAYMEPMLNDPLYRRALGECGPAHTAIADGVVVGCAGLFELWPGRAIAWTVLSADIGPFFVPVHRAVRRFLDGSGVRRIEAHVDVDFAPAHRWLLMLGFRLETPEPMRCFWGERAMYLYARVS